MFYRLLIVSGYVAILTDRSRATEYIDIVLDHLDETKTEQFVIELKNRGYWGMAMPLDDMYSMLSTGDRLRIAEDGELYPNFEIWFVSNSIEREALSQAILAEFDDAQINLSPIELQIAYKLRLAKQMESMTGKDFEDALHLYLTFKERFNREKLELYVDKLGVNEYYDELRHI